MAKFAASGLSGALTTTAKTALGIQQPASSVKGRLEIYQVIISAPGTAADNQLEWVIKRTSTAGTSTAITPTDVDDTGATAVGAAGQTFTAEPTTVSNSVLFDQGLNQRSTFQIMLGPGYEWTLSPTASRGISVGALHASATPTVLATGYWRE